MTSLSTIALTSSTLADAPLAPSSDDELIGDAVLNYFAFGPLFLVVVVPFCEIVAIRAIPRHRER